MPVDGSMKRFGLSSASRDLEHVVEGVLSGEIAVISTDRGGVVMLSSEDYESLLETLYLMGDPDFEKDVADARTLSLEEREVWNRRRSESGGFRGRMSG